MDQRFHTGVHERPLEGLEVETLVSLDSSNRFEALKMLPHRGFPGPDSAPDINGYLQLYRDSKHISHRGRNL